MSGNRSGERPARGPRLLIAITEKYLRKRHVVAADDHLIEFKVGKVQHWAVAGSKQPLPPAHVRLDIRQLRGLSSCSYSAHRMFLVLGSEGIRFANLEFVWHADSRERVLRLVFSSPQLTVVWWEPDAGENEAALAGFAARIIAQRDRALAGLPPESRRRAADHLATLKRSGLLAAALAEQAASPDAAGSAYPGSPALPRTYVGRWLRAAMLDQRELRDELATTLNGGARAGMTTS
ncbi:MAG TPA: hypothetical protein VLM11_20085, partial [Streptosporangiaceae bacterium]|nr:hypothetical protein [Streptosporangiaceae bacterium]